MGTSNYGYFLWHAFVLVLLFPNGYSSATSGGVALTEPDVENHPNWEYLRTDICGAEGNSGINDEEETLLKGYPWLALLRYRTRTGFEFQCGGSLIGNRYVLTAAHCVTGLRNKWLVSVRLGEHNTEMNPDCKKYDGERVCADPFQNFNVSKVIVHPQYELRGRSEHHDIALLRLDRDATFTDYILPICIPNGEAIRKRYDGRTMNVAGWGATKNGTASNEKLWARVPVVNSTLCEPENQQFNLIDNQMCAGGRDSCRGDSGGPLMAVESVVPGREGGQWVAAGILSNGPPICGTEGRPGTYTRVGPYVGWILHSVKP